MRRITSKSSSRSGTALLCIAVLVPIAIIVFALAFVLPVYESWGMHLVSGATFALITVGILDRIIARREKIRREPLKKELISEIGNAAEKILDFIVRLIEGAKTYPYGTKDEFHRMLKELAQRENIKLGKLVGVLIHPDQDRTNRFQLEDYLFEPAEELGELGIKSLDVLEPPFSAALLRIRDIIRRIRSDYRYTESAGGYDEDFIKKRLCEEVSAILKQIHLLDEMKIPLYQPKADR